MTAEYLVDRTLRARSCGRVLAAGPWQDLGHGRWAVPSVAHMSGDLMEDAVVERAKDGWTWCKPKREERHENTDPLGGGPW